MRESSEQNNPPLVFKHNHNSKPALPLKSDGLDKYSLNSEIKERDIVESSRSKGNKSYNKTLIPKTLSLTGSGISLTSESIDCD